MKTKILIMCAALVLASGCATNPANRGGVGNDTVATFELNGSSSETPLTAIVTHVEGGARYCLEGGNGVFQKVQRGTRLTTGSIVQTASNGTVDIMLQEGLETKKFFATGPREKFLRLFENTVLAFDELQVGAAGDAQIRLDLQAGELIAQLNPLRAGKNLETVYWNKLPLDSQAGEFVIFTPMDVAEGSVEANSHNEMTSRMGAKSEK